MCKEFDWSRARQQLEHLGLGGNSCLVAYWRTAVWPALVYGCVSSGPVWVTDPAG